MFVTEHDFELPKGFIDAEGSLHRTGTMRLATAADEILPLRDPRVRDFPPYLVIVLLARVVVRLGTLRELNPGIIERLFTEDLSYLQRTYNRINGLEPQDVRCPGCGFPVTTPGWEPGGSVATPSTGSTGR